MSPVATAAVTRGTRALLVWLSLALGLSASVLVAEAGLRLAGVSYPRTVQRDPHLGTGYRPGITFRTTGEGGADVVINADGFRDRDYPIARSPGTVRIAVLGDSYVDATTVAAEDRFTDRLSLDLAAIAADGRTVEVLNFGMAGYGTAQELLVLRHHVWKYAPDIVLLAFLPFNDIRNNYEPLERDDGRPYFVLQDKQLVLDDSFRTVPDRARSFPGRFAYWLADRMRFVQLAYEVRRRWRRRQEAVDAAENAQALGFLEGGLAAAAFVPPPDEQWEQAWRVSEALIAQMHREVREKGARFLVVILTAGIQVDPDPVVRGRFQKTLGVDHLFYAERRIAELCAREAIPCLPLGEPLQAYATDTGTYVHGFPNTQMGRGHWNETGNAIASRLIARAIVERGLLR
ncbi:MAG: SGNH/GDSL hydrolase family protein [Acidobacteriota bacterium]